MVMAGGGTEESIVTAAIAGATKVGAMKKEKELRLGGGGTTRGSMPNACAITKWTRTATAGGGVKGGNVTAVGGTATSFAPGVTAKGKKGMPVGGLAIEKENMVTVAGGTLAEMKSTKAGGIPKGAGGTPNYATVPGGAVHQCTLPAALTRCGKLPAISPSSLGKSR
jgi:hypothetical protein